MAALLLVGVLCAAALSAGEENTADEDEHARQLASQVAGSVMPPEELPPNALLPPPAQKGTVAGREPKTADGWELLLVNRWNPIPEDCSPSLIQLKNGLYVDERCYPALQRMMDACRGAGLSPVICSAYRAWEDQELLFQSKVSQLEDQGYLLEDAEAEAGTVIALPGTSEHQTGLAVDIVDLNNQKLDRSQEDTAVQGWLLAHSWEYGFILRYPSGKSEITGIIYEPWHYRYVGEAAAKEIHSREICLEEYLEG
ncbi:MAG: M15 family metallopeptidase [Lawsonibacter sp.]|nr:M15 family metallopeptidase [Lawsonibacter sp.]